MASPHWKPPNTNTNNHNEHNHDNTTATCNTSNTYNAYNGRSCSSFSSSPNVFSNKSNSNSNSNSLNNDSNSGSAAHTGFREAGIVEKLLASYGFIQCCERQARLFFHYSQYSGNIEHLKLGDPVEFEMTYDRRTGKPIASTVVKITSEAFMAEELSTERVSGFITTEVSSEREGRVAYENRGECFFLPFVTEDIEDDDKLSSKDRVTFYIGTDKSGNLRARHVKLEIPTPQKHEGVICTLKDSFGFIERADVVKEIFFHSSECKDFKNLILGDDVEFCIQIRNNKEVAVNVNKLSPGSVVFEDVSDAVYNGHIIKTIERQNSHSCSRPQNNNSIAITGAPTDPFPGRIVYKKNNVETEISFGERDVKAEYTLQVNDFVKFNIVTDRRDQLQHSTNVDLVDDAFEISGEHREQGYVAALRDYYGFIKCLNREGTRVYFRLSELLNPNLTLKLNDELEFTVAPDLSSPGRLQAIRIKLLPDGTIFKNIFSPVKNKLVTNTGSLSNGISVYRNSESNMNGNDCDNYETTNEFPLIDFNTELDTSTALNAAEKSASNPNNVTKNSQGIVAKSNSWSEILSQLDIGTNMSEISNEKTKDLLTTASNFFSDQSLSLEPLKPMILQESPKIENNQINLDSQSVLKNKKEISPKLNGPRSSPQTKNGIKYPYRGYVVALKETFGFIEAEDGQRELFFHYSVYDGNVDMLELGDHVEYSTSYKNSKLTALAVRKTSTKIADDLVQSDIMTGMVTRTVRTFNPDQSEYTGLIRVVNENTEKKSDIDSPPIQYEFSMIGLMEMHEFIQKGDVVKFQIGFNPVTETERAVNIKPIRTKHQGTIECIKGSFGFLNCEANEDGKNNLFFHMSEVKGNSNNLQPGDVVEFVVLHSQRSGKYSACNIVKIGETQAIRPERLTRVKIEECGPRVVVIRNPKGPDGTKGFNNRATVVVK